jgi:hypothetical protein
MSRISSSDPSSCATAPSEAAKCEKNGIASDSAPGESPGANCAQTDEKTSVDRVEEMMDDFGNKVGGFTSKIGQQVVRLAARTRESLEDFWAEAQCIRRGEKEEPSQESGGR